MQIQCVWKKGFIIFLLSAAFLWNAVAQEDIPALVKKIQPSIVMIITYDENDSALLQGTGFFINAKGDVISNRHVFEGAIKGVIKASDGRIYPIKQYLAEDRDGDLLMVSVDIPKKFVHALKVSSIVPAVGEKIVVIGNPNGFEQTVSDGIVSAVREIPGFGNIIQITAPISQGSSGSPVVNMKGNVIGVATLISTEGQNLNFAVPGERVVMLKPDTTKTVKEWKTGTTDDTFATAEALYGKGRNFLWAKDYTKAISCFEELVKIFPQFAEAYFQIGSCMSQLGWEYLYEKGSNVLWVEYYEKAISYFKQAAKIDPLFAETYFQIGSCMSYLGREQEAIEAFKQAISIKPDYAYAYYNLGMSYAKLKRYQEAIEAYKQAIRINPDFEEAYTMLGVSYGSIGREKEASECYKQGTRVGKLGVIEVWKQTIRTKPDDAEAHYNLGVAYLDAGDKGSALDEYKVLKDLNRDFANKLFNLIYK